jgi:NTE family protein
VSPSRPKSPRPIALALQGGGAHGAFTWGVLDQLIEDGRLSFEAVSGASAGAMNAVVMADGWTEGGPDGARAQLERFWRAMSLDGEFSLAQRSVFDRLLMPSPLNGFGLATFWANIWNATTTPYSRNPLDINPLKDFLEREIDFARVRACTAFKLAISATNVETGRIRVFTRDELTAEHVMASACLPSVFQAVEIDGVPYWDGGYMGNPALFPLFYGLSTRDILLVQINPITRKGTPRTPAEIENRLNEITFNASLLSELRAVAFVNRLVAAGDLKPPRYQQVLMHRIALSESLSDVDAASKTSARWDFFQTLKNAGRKAARRWLKAHADDVGRRGTLDLSQELG